VIQSEEHEETEYSKNKGLVSSVQIWKESDTLPQPKGSIAPSEQEESKESKSDIKIKPKMQTTKSKLDLAVQKGN
jgi:hypothetical protein